MSKELVKAIQGRWNKQKSERLAWEALFEANWIAGGDDHFYTYLLYDPRVVVNSFSSFISSIFYAGKGIDQRCLRCGRQGSGSSVSEDLQDHRPDEEQERRRDHHMQPGLSRVKAPLAVGKGALTNLCDGQKEDPSTMNWLRQLLQNLEVDGAILHDTMDDWTGKSMSAERQEARRTVMLLK